MRLHQFYPIKLGMDWQIYKNIIRIDFYNMEYLIVYFFKPSEIKSNLFLFYESIFDSINVDSMIRN
jgi:hypothetical protein